MSPEGLSERAWTWMKLRHPRTRDFWLYYPNDDDGGHQVLRVCDRGGDDFAVLIWNTCEACRRGVIAKISIAEHRHRQGIGRRLVLRAMHGRGDYHWTTSSQSPMAQQFFPALARETAAAFTAGEPSCPHIRAGRRSFPTPHLEAAEH